MILICGGLADSVTELVCARLADCGYPYRLLDLGTYPAGFEINWHWQGSGPSGYIAGPDWKIDLHELTGVYIRYLGPEGRVPPPNIEPGLAPAMYFEYDTGLMALLEDLPCAVVNRLEGGMSNSSKAYQALLVRQCGLMTPPTLVTNDAAAARRFFEDYSGEVIYKSLSGVRSIVRRMDQEHLARLPLLRHGPAQFQAFIPGENVRVHTVGDQLFATRVHSQTVDYRYASREGGEVEMEPTTLPANVAESCLRLARQLDLLLTGIDLKETPDGDYYCFEINPCPGFLYYERHTHQPISTALAELLHHGLTSIPQRRKEHAYAMNTGGTSRVWPSRPEQ
ncbi:MAG: ATP-grasp domain-containing protein [Pyrinomonadaceae bacterium]